MAGIAAHRIPDNDRTNTAVWPDGAASLSNAAAAARTQESQECNPVLNLDEVLALYTEVFEAQQVQRRLSGARRLKRGQLEIVAEIFPIQHFSGDFVCTFDQGDSTFIALGDVAGKGLTAAMWSTHVMSLVRTRSTSLDEPSQIISAINRDLCTVGSGVPITTMFFAKLDWHRSELTYSNAGHFPPFITRERGETQRLSVGGPALGVIASSEFNQARVQLDSSDMFIGYSDGLIECRNCDDEEFGIERLVSQAKQASTLSASRALFSIIAAAQDFAHGVQRTDDLTLLVISGASSR
jgi:serine phosphatase RsbU (regulator of sigma subunit)